MPEKTSVLEGAVDQLNQETYLAVPKCSVAEDLPLAQLFIDEETGETKGYQRKTIWDQVLKVADGVKPVEYQRIQVSLRDDGRYAILDGGQRFHGTRIICMTDENAKKAKALLRKYKRSNDKVLRAALLALPVIGNPLVPCEVYALTFEEEAEQYYCRHDNAKRQDATDRYKARIAARDPLALSVNRILTKYGIEVAYEGRTGFRAVDVCLYVEKASPSRLDEVLKVLKQWQLDPDIIFTGNHIKGMHIFLRQWQPDKIFKMDTFFAALSRIDIRGLEVAASRYRAEKMFGPKCIKYALEDTYNKGLLSRNKLPRKSRLTD